MIRCKQHQYELFLLSLVPNVVRQCKHCGNMQIQMLGVEGRSLMWNDITILDLFGKSIYIITGSMQSFEASKMFLAEDYHLPADVFLPLITDADMRGFNQICEEGGRPCVVLNPVDWFENPYLPEWNVAMALSSNIGGILMRPTESAGYDG